MSLDYIMKFYEKERHNLPSRLEWTVGSLATLANPPKILLGGLAAASSVHSATDIGADGIALNLHDAVLEGRRLVGIAREPVPLHEHLQSLGQKVQEIRRDLGWNQQKLADNADLDRTDITAVEHGKQNLTLGTIVKLADALGVELVQLLSKNDRL